MPTRVITLRNVEVVRESDSSILCRIEGHDRWIPTEQLREGTTIRRRGDVGTLVVPRAFAAEWGLTPFDE
jgi:hypothetical protein